MKRYFLVALGAVILVSLPGLIGAGMFFWKFSPHIPAADYAPPANQAEARLQDLDYLRRIPEADKSFSDAEIAALNAHIDALEAQVETLSEAEFLMALAAGPAITENGHTKMSLHALMNRLNSLPVRFAWFADGLFIVRARAAHADLIGARVIRYGERDPDAIVAALDPYHGGNDAFRRADSAYFYAAPAGLHAIGLIAEPGRVTLELAGADGEAFSRTLEVEDAPTRVMRATAHGLAQASDAEAESGHDWRFLDPATSEATWFGRHPGRPVWSEALEGGGVYWRLRDVIGDDEAPLPAWLEAEAERLRAAPARFLVIDLRSNIGGDYTRSMGVMREILTLVEPGGRIYVLTDGATFSAGVVTAALALAHGGGQAVMVGESMGDDAQFWAEGGGVMRLPNSDLPLLVSTAYHDWENGCTDWSRCYWLNIIFGVAAGPLDVDLPAGLRFEDYRRGVDTGMEAVLAAETARSDRP